MEMSDPKAIEGKKISTYVPEEGLIKPQHRGITEMQEALKKDWAVEKFFRHESALANLRERLTGVPEYLKAAPQETVAPKASDVQIGGTHYRDKKVQPWDAMEAWMSPEQFAGFLRGNAIKYLARSDDKGDTLTDIRKCIHYAQKLVELLENESAKTD